MTLYGLHISVGAGHAKAVEYAKELGCTAVQFFCGNPRSLRTTPFDAEKWAAFADLREEAGIARAVIHTSYLINLASDDADAVARSVERIRYDLAVADAGRIAFVNTHLGSYGTRDRNAGFASVVAALERALDGIAPEVTLVLENSAGAGNLCGGTIEELGALLRAVDHPQLAICIDTAHAWAAGYNIDHAAGVDALFGLIAEEIGLDRLRMLHVNDTQIPLGGRRDRHWHLGEGLIGISGLHALMHRPELADTTAIIETPGDPNDDARNMATMHRILEDHSA